MLGNHVHSLPKNYPSGHKSKSLSLIQPENILLTKNFTVKICDFGFATEEAQSNFFCGTPEYMAPEILLKKNYDFRIDIWSLGILYFELIEGKVPFRGNSEGAVLAEMK